MYYLRTSKKIGFLAAALLSVVFLYFVAHGSSANAVWPVASGVDVRIDGNFRLDCSNVIDGYAMMSVAAPSGNPMKVQVMYNGNQLLYDLKNTGEYEVLPLQFGPGDYSISLFENVGGSKYASGGKIDLSVPEMVANAAFLVPNQYVNYTPSSPSVLRSDEITNDSMTDTQKFEAVCNLIASEFSYDFVRAQTIAAGELPAVDQCYNNRAGICQDLSAVTISMLRAQGIPSRLLIGYADGYYHAWTMSVVDGQEKFFDPTQAVGALNASNYVVERFY